MTFIVVPKPFNTASKNTNAAVEIQDWKEDGRQIHAGFVSPEPGSSVDTKKLAQNLADFMNGINASEFFGIVGRTMHYRLLASGIVFSFHEHNGKGMSLGNSVDAAVFHVAEDYRQLFQKRVDLMPEKLGYVLAGGSKTNRRGKKRTLGASSRSPSQRPIP
jgi:hypothetical protein